MVRAPCCEKMGLKKGPWAQEEDQVLVSYIQRYGHVNWRALPKQAGLLRCGKSCRLRWINYLRPDIKRGNFSREEEDMVINLHQMLGNRWSAIAARLPGRTDNEIKNVWHTHLKKRVKPDCSTEDSDSKLEYESKTKCVTKPVAMKQDSMIMHTNSNVANPSIENSSSDWSQSDNSSSSTTNLSNHMKDEFTESSSQEYQEFIDDSFWNETLKIDNSINSMNENLGNYGEDWRPKNSLNDEDKEFWLKLFMEAGELFDLPEL